MTHGICSIGYNVVLEFSDEVDMSEVNIIGIDIVETDMKYNRMDTKCPRVTNLQHS